MLMTGDFISAEQAVDWGLLNKCVATDNLDKEVDSLAMQICQKSQVAVTTGKTLFYKQLEKPLDEAYELAGNAMACNMMSEDVKEGIDAFLKSANPAGRIAKASLILQAWYFLQYLLAIGIKP